MRMLMNIILCVVGLQLVYYFLVRSWIVRSVIFSFKLTRESFKFIYGLLRAVYVVVSDKNDSLVKFQCTCKSNDQKNVINFKNESLKRRAK